MCGYHAMLLNKLKLVLHYQRFSILLIFFVRNVSPHDENRSYTTSINLTLTCVRKEPLFFKIALLMFVCCLSGLPGELLSGQLVLTHAKH